MECLRPFRFGCLQLFPVADARFDRYDDHQLEYFEKAQQTDAEKQVQVTAENADQLHYAYFRLFFGHHTRQVVEHDLDVNNILEQIFFRIGA